MRIERVIEELAQELAKKAGVNWSKLIEDDREQYRKQARAKTEEVKKRYADPVHKYAE